MQNNITLFMCVGGKVKKRGRILFNERLTLKTIMFTETCNPKDTRENANNFKNRKYKKRTLGKKFNKYEMIEK